MFDNYNHSYQMNALQKSFSIFKTKKMNVFFDEEWVLCDLHNNKTEPILSTIPEPILSTIPITLTMPIKIADTKIIGLSTPVNIFGWFYFLYQGAMDVMEEIFALQVFLLFDENRMPPSFCI